MLAILPRRTCCLILTLTCAVFSTATASTNSWTSWGAPTGSAPAHGDWERQWNGNGGVGSSSSNSAWQLGITGINTDTGVVARQINANSPAAQAGIAPGDTIICVGGDQVGRVGNQLFDLSEEINRHADSFGRVLLLVQSRQNGQIRSLNIQLANQRGGLSGTLTTRGGMLPQNSVVTVKLENVTRPYQVVRNGQVSFRLSSFNMSSIPFELNFDPAYISPNDTYRVRAYITSGGQTIYDTPQPPYVLTRGYPNSVQIELSPSAFSPSDNIVTASYTPADNYAQQINAAYQRYLGRMPTSVELAAWYQTPDLNYRVQRLPLELMATQEYFDRYGANDYAWVRQSFTEVIGKAPSSVEMDLWMRRFGELRYSRTELLNQMQMQANR